MPPSQHASDPMRGMRRLCGDSAVGAGGPGELYMVTSVMARQATRMYQIPMRNGNIGGRR